MKRTAAIFASLFVLTGLSATPASADVYQTQGWEDRSIVVVDLGSKSYGIGDAVKSWNASGSPITLELAKKSVKSCAGVQGACVTVRAGSLPDDIGGIADGEFFGPGPITQCEITLADHFKGKEAAFYGTSIFLHEMGHCVGPNHTSYTNVSIMVPTITGYDRLQPYDIADLNTIYP